MKFLRPGVGDVLKKLRQEKGLTLRELSRATGLDSAYLSRIERGLVPPSETALRTLTLFFRTPELYIAAGKILPEPLRLELLPEVPRLLREIGFRKLPPEPIAEEALKEFPLEDPYVPYIESSVGEATPPGIYPPGDFWRDDYDALAIPYVFIHLPPLIRVEVIDNFLKLKHEEAVAGYEPSPEASYLEGYIGGLCRAYGLLKKTLKKYGLFWFLAGFLPPHECRALATVYNAALKDKQMEPDSQKEPPNGGPRKDDR